MGLTPEDLPERVEGWNIARSPGLAGHRRRPADAGQLDALRGWVAGGGRLVIAGGTAGPKALAAFPDALLPYRPTATTDVPAADLAGLLGELPDGRDDLPALSGELDRGARARHGRRPGRRRRAAYGVGPGHAPRLRPGGRLDRRDRHRAGRCGAACCRRGRSAAWSFFDDNMLVSAVSQLPSLALPPIGGLIVLLGAYILLIGPINYLVLRRLDRREWAWLTMPVLIVVFAVGASASGPPCAAATSIVNEVAIVRGAPGATEARPRSTSGIFSPSRGTYQVSVPGGALLSSPINGDFFGGTGHGRRRSTSCRAIRRGSATSRSVSDRCGRSAPRRRSTVPLDRRPTCGSRTAG